MSWSALPLDLFALVVAIVEPDDAVKLEAVCKTWNENLKNDLIWQGLCHTRGQLQNTYESWKVYALKYHVVRKNMENNRFLSRAFATSRDGQRRYGTIEAYCSIAGNEVLITWAEFENYSSFWFTHFMSHEIINLETWVRTPVTLPNPKALLTSKYIVSTDYAPGSFNCKRTLLITDRSSKEAKSVTITEIKADEEAMWLANSNVECQTIAVLRNQEYFIIDLVTGHYTVHHWKSPLYVDACQLVGKYFVFKSASKDNIHILDTESDKEVMAFPLSQEDSATFYFDESHLLIVLANSWLIIDVATRTAKKFLTSLSGGSYAFVSPLLHKNYVVIRHGSLLYFFNKDSGSCISTLNLHGISAYVGANAHLSSYGAGKFIVASESTARVLDFESASIDSEIAVVVIDSKHKSSQFVQFGKLLEYTATYNNVSVGQIVSVLITQSDNYRISMAYTGASFLAPSAADNKNVNDLATKILNQNVRDFQTSINLVATSSANDAKSLTMSTKFNTQWSQRVVGAAIFYKEEFKHGTWVPVDMVYDPNFFK